MKYRIIPVPLITLFSFFILCTACAQPKAEWQGTIEEMDGVTVVKNPKEPMYEEDIIKIEEELTIGEAGGREEYLFENLWFIVVDDRERIFISEGAGNRAHIKVFNNLGDYLMTIGRRGEGPGEFLQVSSIQITQENELLVFDKYSTKLTFFSLDGEYLRTVLMNGIQALNLVQTSLGNYVLYRADFKSQIDSGSYSVANEVMEYSSDFDFIKTIAKDKYRSSTSFQSWMMGRFFPPDKIICGHSENYEICFYSSEGEVEKRISKDFIPMAISDSEKERRGILKKETPKYFPAFEDFSLDEEGRLVVKTYERYEDGEKYWYDVFDSEGKYITKTHFPALPKYWKNDKLYTIETDKDGFQYVKRYKVTWNY